ncbi:MAG: TonB family protein [Terracidiphilus sp.]
MFEDSTFESAGRIRTRSAGWMMATFALNGAILLALILFPLLYPEALPRMAESILMEAPAPPTEETKPHPLPAHTVVVQPQVQGTSIQAPPVIPKNIAYLDKPEVLSNIDVRSFDSNPNGAASPDNPLNVRNRITVVQSEPKKPVRIPSSMIEGLLLFKITPTYPAIAKATGTQGTVVLQATISKSGTIENLRVAGGLTLLEQAALDAVKQWRYRPYLLNGEPVEVETTVNVIFKLD